VEGGVLIVGKKEYNIYMRLGYCCINLSLKDQGISTNRGMIRKTFDSAGLEYVSLLIMNNLADLLTILKWNKQNEIYVYRMSSDLFPWMSEYKFEDLPSYGPISRLAAKVGELVSENNMRLSFHPGQFDVLASPNSNVVQKTIYDLDQHARIMDMMKLPQDHRAAINIHIGGSYGDKHSALERFCENFKLLAPSTKARLVVENDDKASQFGVIDLFDGVYKVVGCPITFDHFHHRFCTNDISAEQAALLAASTWGDVTPLQHFSSSKALYEDASVINRSHADYVYDTVPDYGFEADVEIEAKAKDLALLRYRERDGIVTEELKFEFEIA
jgi:UV DNA damage endonuclease